MKIGFDDVVSAVALGAEIGPCADIMLGDHFVGYPWDDVSPDYPASHKDNPLEVRARRVTNEVGESVWVPCKEY